MDFLQGGGGIFFSYIFIFYAISFRSDGVGEESIKEPSFYLQRIMNQKKTQTSCS